MYNSHSYSRLTIKSSRSVSIRVTKRSKEYADFVGKLKQARLDAGLRQVAVAMMLKRTQSYVSRVEVGEQRLDVLELKNLQICIKKTSIS